MPTQQSLNRYYLGYHDFNREADENLAKKRDTQYDIDYNYIQEYVGKCSNVLDIGCSSGKFLNYFHGSNLYGLEPDAVSRAKIIETNPNIFAMDSINTLKEDKYFNKFDLVIMRGVIEHFEDPKYVFDVVEKILARNGKIVLLMTPYSEAPSLEIFGEKWAMFNPVEHLWFFNEKSLNLLNSNLKVRRIDFPYRGTPYENLRTDILRFADKIRDSEEHSQWSPAFFENVFNCVIDVVR